MTVSMGLESVIDVSRRGAGARETLIEVPRDVSSGLETFIDMSMSLSEGPEGSGTRHRCSPAITSVPLNLHEGAYSQGRNAGARFHHALGSAAEVRACLDVAEALGYLEPAPATLLATTT
jgi:four helix bundle protein